MKKKKLNLWVAFHFHNFVVSFIWFSNINIRSNSNWQFFW